MNDSDYDIKRTVDLNGGDGKPTVSATGERI